MIELDGTMPCYQLIITITIFHKESIVVSLEEGLLVVILKIIIKIMEIGLLETKPLQF